jgi:hypothetical protein
MFSIELHEKPYDLSPGQTKTYHGRLGNSKSSHRYAGVIVLGAAAITSGNSSCMVYNVDNSKSKIYILKRNYPFYKVILNLTDNYNQVCIFTLQYSLIREPS